MAERTERAADVWKEPRQHQADVQRREPAAREPSGEPQRIDALLPPAADDSPQPASPPTPGSTLEPPASADHLLPPGAEQPATPSNRAGSSRAANDLLPPGADEPVSLPQPTSADSPKAFRGGATRAADGSLLIPTEDGRQVAVQEPVKSVVAGGEERPLRQRTPEERAARRFKKNLIIWTIGIILIATTVIILLRMGPL